MTGQCSRLQAAQGALMATAMNMEVGCRDPRSVTLSAFATPELVTINMDAGLGEALEICIERRIRHLPVVDENGKLVGILTDRDIRASLSPRLGTISENESDRVTLRRRVHVYMHRQIVTGTPEMPLAGAAALMLEHRVGCLPVVDEDRRLVGIVTTSDFLRFLAS